MLRPQKGENHETYSITVSDITNILPVTLEVLFLDGVFEDADWVILKTLLDTTGAPLLKLSSVCFRKYDAYWSNFARRSVE